ncbi:MAG: hypothetical protein KBT50_04095 [Cycloclasticus sp.]|nr:hypothetical protein [Cycloclasticus sp.]MBQ0789778.1 hypothetical protein [Cycloclasticus sp.]
MNRYFFVTVLCAASISTAFADSQFSGSYVGAQIGYAEGNDDGREYSDGDPTSYTQDTSPNGEFLVLRQE